MENSKIKEASNVRLSDMLENDLAISLAKDFLAYPTPELNESQPGKKKINSRYFTSMIFFLKEKALNSSKYFKSGNQMCLRMPSSLYQRIVLWM